MNNQTLLIAFLAVGIGWLLSGRRDRMEEFLDENGGPISFPSPFPEDPAEKTQPGFSGRGPFPSNIEQWRSTVRAMMSAETTPDVLTVDVVLSLILQESSGRPDAVGSAGEKGLMQMKPIAMQDVGGTEVPSDPAQQIRAGIRFLSLQINRMDGDLFDGLRAYNAGATGARRSASNGRRYANQILARL